MIHGSVSTIVKLLTTIEFTLRLCIFCYRHEIKCKNRAIEARKRRPRRRFDWANFRDSLSDHQFRRMFRMTKRDFDALCSAVLTAVGEEEFKPESFIETSLMIEPEDISGSVNHYKKRRMFYANSMTTGGYINGETKLAIILRFMASDSFLNVAALYCCGYTYANQIFHITIER